MTLVGALIGDLLGDPQRYGLDAAAAAAFCALLWPRLKNGETRAVAGGRRPRGAAGRPARPGRRPRPRRRPGRCRRRPAPAAGPRRRADEPLGDGAARASAIAFGLKLAGHVVPHSWLDGARRRPDRRDAAGGAAGRAGRGADVHHHRRHVRRRRARRCAWRWRWSRSRCGRRSWWSWCWPPRRPPACAPSAGPPSVGAPSRPGRRSGERATRQARTAARYSRCSAGRSLRWRCCSASSRCPRHTSSAGRGAAPECSCASSSPSRRGRRRPAARSPRA